MTPARPLPPLARRLVLGFALALAGPATAADLAIVGTAHLEQLQPAPSPAQAEAVVDTLARWQPTLVCIEALPGERVAQFLRDPARHGELLDTFARPAVRLGAEQQVRRGLDAAGAREAAQALATREGTLSNDDQLRLVSLHLAAHEPWSAALVWSGIDATGREAAPPVLGRAAIDGLEALLASGNEINRIALPLARRAGHRQLCHADAFFDEVAVGALAPELMPTLQDPAIAAGLARFNDENARHWDASRPDGLVRLLAWMQSGDFARLDRATEWDIFATDPAPHDAGERRLMLWHARNAEITALLHRALARPEGARVLMLVGAAHRPFLEATAQAQPWLRVHAAQALFEGR